MVVTGLTLNLAGVSAPMAAEKKVFGFNRSTKLAQSFQVRCEGSSGSRAPDTVKVARRELAFGLTAACLTLATGNAEARIVKPEIRRKIREKLEMLREKAGLSKKKDDGQKVSPPPPPSLLNKEKKQIPLEPPPLPLPTPTESTTLVEATVGVE